MSGAAVTWVRSRPRVGWDWIRREPWFAVLFAVGALLRALALLGFRPILWFNDGMEYLGVALRMQPYVVRPDGYSFLLRALLPFHRFAVVALVQHLMGLATAVMLYALLRKWRVRPWLAALGVAPQLLDAHQIELEQVLLSDTMFTFLAVAALTVAAWRSRLSPRTAAILGLLAAAAALTRSIGLPLLVLLGLFVLVRWPGWRPVAAFAATAVIPLAAYAMWFHSANGSFALTESDGVFLYSRTAVFADCSKINLPPELKQLCPAQPVGHRDYSNGFIWHVSSPLRNLPGKINPEPIPSQVFTEQRNAFGRSFAIRAILAQPGAYLKTGWLDFLRTFAWTRQPYPMPLDLQAYEFSRTPVQMNLAETFVIGATSGSDMNTYQPGTNASRAVAPFSTILIVYQHIGAVPGPAVAVLLVIGLIGVVAWRRRDERRWQVGLLFVTGLMLLLVPPFTAEFDYRYVLPALPVLGAMAALALSVLVPRWTTPAPSDTPAPIDTDDDGASAAEADDEAVSTLAT